MLANHLVLEQKKFTVYKSSAGSGKTYTLVREYLSLALKFKRSDELKHILAITFTNKAAAEMKERIVSTLHAFSTGKPKGAAAIMFTDLVNTNKIADRELQQRSKAALDFILHHYSDFAVSTIDKFNHKIIRSFAFDLRLPVNFDLETDIEEVLQQAVDGLLAQSGKNESLTKVLLAYIEDLLQDEKSWNIGMELMDFGKQLFDESIAKKINALKALDLESFLTINKTLNTFIFSFRERLVDIGNRALDLLNKNNVDHSNLAGGASSGIGKYFTYLQQFRDDKLEASNSVRNNFQNQKLYATKVKGNERLVIESITTELTSLFQEAENMLEEQFNRYKVYKLIKSNLFSVAVLNELEKLILELKQKNNILFISEFNKIISEAIANEPAPYIYERLGERYRHFLIDEFQDTSVMQWRNLLPLIHNALSQGFFNMIVGDTKQSIYRWRNGEVEQLARLPYLFSEETLTTTMQEQEATLVANHNDQVLRTNFRSKANIVHFNNDFFEFLSDATSHDFSSIYGNSAQETAPNKEGGSVNIGVFEGEGDERLDWMLNRVLENVQCCLENGYQKKDIAIITRGNADGAQIAAFLMDQGIDVISKESLLLSTSAEVRFIVELIKFIENASNEICIASIKYYLIHHLNFKVAPLLQKNSYSTLLAIFNDNGIEFSTEYFKSLPLFELCNELTILFGLHQTSNAYIKFFLDQIFAYGLNHVSISELLKWWEQKGHKFSIIVPDGVNAVNVMTIHKSKGLQYPVVILPYADLSINTRGIKHWVTLNETAFPTLKYALINHGELMSQSNFADLHAEEGRKIMLDQLNMMYVAFTRAEEHLFILSGKRRNSMHQYIEQFVKNNSFNTKEIKGVTYFSVGAIHELQVQKESPETKADSSLVAENISWKSLLQTSGLVYTTARENTKLKYGNLIHKMLSEINHSIDLEPVIKKYSFEIEREKLDINIIKNKLLQVVQHEELKHYFDGTYLIKKESSILNTKGKILRPDFVAIKVEKAAIIDYKTGEPRVEYAAQLKEYADLITQMGYKVEARVVVYVDNESIAFV